MKSTSIHVVSCADFGELTLDFAEKFPFGGVMRMTPVTLGIAILFASMTAPVLAGGDKTPVPPLLTFTEAPLWKLSGGWQMRSLGEFSLHTGARSAGFLLPSLIELRGNTRFRAGNETDVSDRFYDNGYVLQDIGTEVDGLTQHWGNTQVGQIRSDTVVFDASSVSARSASARRDFGIATWGEDVEEAGPWIAFSRSLWQRNAWSIGADLQASYTPFTASDSFRSLLASQSSAFSTATLRDTYTLLTQDPLPPIYQGEPDSDGAIINAIPASRTRGQGPRGADAIRFWNQGSTDFDLDTFSFSLGASAVWNWHPVQLTVGAGAVLQIADWEANQRETIFAQRAGGARRTVRTWTDHAEDTAYLPGFYLQAGLCYALTSAWSLELFGRYDWSDALEGSVGPSAFSLEMAGWSYGAGIGYRF
jgi:hypothetical protein